MLTDPTLPRDGTDREALEMRGSSATRRYRVTVLTVDPIGTDQITERSQFPCDGASGSAKVTRAEMWSAADT